ncbi:RNA helicase family protein, partial [Striga asiatica]
VTDIENLVVAPISKASARQRAGRAGRVRPGKCYRLYTEEYFMNEMSPDGVPEMQRSNLVSCVIQLKALGIDNILGFDWPASSSPEALIRALEVFYSLGVIDDDAKLTSPAGFQIAEIPLEPMISKMILAANDYGCSEEIITIAAVLSIQSIWFSDRGAQMELDEAKLRFAASEGDHVTFLNVYKGFIESGKSSNWCHKNHVNYHAMKKVDEIRKQLRRIVQRLGIALKSCEGDMQVVRKAITAGFFANACRLDAFSHNGLYKTIRSSQEVYIHPSSVLFSRLISNDGQIMMISDGGDEPKSGPGFLEWGFSTKIETCEPTYGFLPCSSNAWGLLFLIVVYEILLSIGGRYVGMGSELFFQMIGPGIFGASLFQLLGTIPQIVLLLVSALSGSVEAAQQRATLGMGLVAGSTVMLLTLVWGICVVLGSYDLSEAPTDDDKSASPNKFSKAGSNYGVITDAETSYTARLMLITLVPFFVLLLTKVFSSSNGRRVIILIAFIITVVLLVAYIFYQIFRPWVQNRRFEYLMNKYAKDKLLRLLSRNGKPDTSKIQRLFDRIDKDSSASVSALELRVLLLGLKLDDDLSTERDVQNVLESFDVSGDGRITRDEFITGMTKLVYDLFDQTPGLVKVSGAFSFVIFGTVLLCALSEPLIKSVVGFSQASNLSSFSVSYLAIPFAMNYGVAVNSIASARQKSQKSISLTLSSAFVGRCFRRNFGGFDRLHLDDCAHEHADNFYSSHGLSCAATVPDFVGLGLFAYYIFHVMRPLQEQNQII